MSLRTGGREAVEDTPVTGATEEQILAAAQRNLSPIHGRTVVIESDINKITYYAEILVPVGYVIVRAEDALTAEDRAAIGRAIEHIKYDGEYDGFPSDLARLRAIAAGGTE